MVINRGGWSPQRSLTSWTTSWAHSPTRARDDGQDQLVLGIIGEVVPPVPLVVVGRVGGVAVLLLLTDERPGLVELDLASPRGKKPRARLERRGHDRRRFG